MLLSSSVGTLAGDVQMSPFSGDKHLGPHPSAALAAQAIQAVLPCLVLKQSEPQFSQVQSQPPY